MEKIKYFANKPSAVLVREESTFTELSATDNGEYVPEGYDGYSKVTVDVQPVLEELEVTENRVYLPTSPTQGFSKVTAAVPVPILETLNATENRTYTAPTGKAYDEVVVNVPSQAPVLVTKSITSNGVYNASQDNADGYSSVSVSVSIAGAPTLHAPYLTNGTTANPLIATANTNNGDFAPVFVLNVNGVDIELDGVGVNSQFVPWIYSATPLAGGTFAVSCKATGSGFNDSNAYAESVTIPSATATTGYIGVNGLGNSNPTSLTYTYDENFPRSFQKVQDTHENVFIKIPTIYRKVFASSNGQITSYALATSALDSDYKPYPCFVDETNGNAILPFVLFGVYCVSNANKANSVDASPVNMRIANARTLCRNRGIGYQQYDWKFEKLFRDLGVVLSRYININSAQSIYDIMGIKHQDKYVWADGVFRGSTEGPTAWYVCETEANYQNGGGGTSQSTTVSEADILSMGYAKLAYSAPSANEYIAKLGYDTNHPFLNYPDGSRDSAGTSSTFYCDQYYQGSGCRPVCCSVGYSSSGSGWFFCSTNVDWQYSYAVRLCYRPILGATGYTE